MALPTSQQLDGHLSKALLDTSSALRLAFSEGVGTIKDFKLTTEALNELASVVETEEAIEASRTIGNTMKQPQDSSALISNTQKRCSSGATKNVAVFLDGSSNSYEALRWAVCLGVVCPRDELFLLSISSYDDFRADSERILKQGYEYAHFNGIKASKIHVKALSAKAWSATGGVGEAAKSFVEGSSIDLVVLGSRGMGSIKRSILGAVGMGSLSDYCVQHLECAVLIVREKSVPPAAAEEEAK